jgi:CRP-like cAMP-binding protein
MIDDATGEEQQRLLAEVDVLRELPEREINDVATRSPIVRLGEKESLALGEDLRGILFLVSGRVRVHEPNFGGQDLTFSVVEGGTLVGQGCPTPRPSRPSLVEALEPSVLRVVEQQDFEDLVSRNPRVGVDTIRLLGERLDAYEARLSDLIRKEVPARLAGLLLRLSEREGAEPGGDFLDEQLSNPTSPLIVGGERILSAEFQEETRARQVLETIGSGERTFTTIQRRADIHETTLQAGDASNHEPEARRIRGLDQMARENALRRSRPGAHRGATRRGPQNGRRYRPGRRLQRGIRRARQRSRRGPRSRVPAESVCRGCCQVPGTEGQDNSH